MGESIILEYTTERLTDMVLAAPIATGIAGNAFTDTVNGVLVIQIPRNQNAAVNDLIELFINNTGMTGAAKYSVRRTTSTGAITITTKHSDYIIGSNTIRYRITDGVGNTDQNSISNITTVTKAIGLRFVPYSIRRTIWPQNPQLYNHYITGYVQFADGRAAPNQTFVAEGGGAGSTIIPSGIITILSATTARLTSTPLSDNARVGFLVRAPLQSPVTFRILNFTYTFPSGPTGELRILR